jgi:hypothetical protein
MYVAVTSKRVKIFASRFVNLFYFFLTLTILRNWYENIDCFKERNTNAPQTEGQPHNSHSRFRH